MTIPVGCFCAYTWHPARDGRVVRNGPNASCRADHAKVDDAMPEPESGDEPQVIVATPDDYLLVVTVEHNGRADLRTSLPLEQVIRFLHRYADDLERGNYGPGAIGGSL
jgi:hypothetical protein